MAKKKHISMRDLSLRQVRKLRKQIILNSLYTNDYVNSYGIDPKEVQSYFDGFVDYLCEISKEMSPKHVDSMYVLKRALRIERENPKHLKDYYFTVDLL